MAEEQGAAMLRDAKALATKKKLTWGAMNSIDQASIMKQAHTIATKAEAASKLRGTTTKTNTPKQKAAIALRKQTTYIDETNFKAMQKKYHPKQIAWATEIKDGHRMWRAGRKMSNFKFDKVKDKKEIEEIRKLQAAKK